MGSMRMAVSTRLFTPMAPRALLSASELMTVFACLRQADERGFRTLYVSCPSEEGMGLAVYNRLLRAAAFEVIELGE